MQIARNVHFLDLNTANAYLVGEREGPWVVVDSGTPGCFEAIKKAAEKLYGDGARPDAIILTHAHIDHYGSALALATFWGVPIYAHRMDLPYLTGKAVLPPYDPTMEGFFAFVVRFLPPSGTDLGESVRALPDDGTVPGMPGWKWYATPGHTPGHVSLFREGDRTLIAGDAVLPVDTDELSKVVSKKQEVSRPPAPATYDWIAARRSINLLASLRPEVLASGHGIPMVGAHVPGQLQAFADDFMSPLYGRYVPEPAVFDQNGVVWVPPSAPDPLLKVATGVGLAAMAGVAAYLVTKKRRGGR
jgi:glyoxylase-like metal-dependent hydrolase (beta-lactamase superfamily II)